MTGASTSTPPSCGFDFIQLSLAFYPKILGLFFLSVGFLFLPFDRVFVVGFAFGVLKGLTLPTMLANVVALAPLTLLVPLASAVPQAPGPSALPQCTYVCPTLDKAGWQAVPFMDPSPTEIFCSYPTVANENPLDFYCIYSKVSRRLRLWFHSPLQSLTSFSRCLA